MSVDAEQEAEVATDSALAHALVAEQFPAWSNLPVSRAGAPSTDNDIYRLGDHMAVRLPRRASATVSIGKEHAWLPRLAPALPTPIPLPIARGEPAAGYPYSWGVVQWLGGAPPGPADQASERLAQDLARFVAALHAVDPADGPRFGPHNHWRGAPLKGFDPEMRRRFQQLDDLSDIAAIAAAWDQGLAAEPSSDPPVWIHGDLKSTNLLSSNGALTGVLDWSLAGLGDPACDLALAWTLFDAQARPAFRDAIGADPAAWARARAWALVEGVFALSYYRNSNADLAKSGREVIDRVLGDHR